MIRRSRAGLVAVAFMAVAVALTACTASPQGSPTSSGATATSAGSSKELPPLTEAYKKWQVDYTHCLRDNGVTIKDPTSDGVIDDSVSHDAAFNAASEKCGEVVGDPPPATEETAMGTEDIYQQQLETAQCLRANGRNVPDPKRGEAWQTDDGSRTPIPQSLWAKCDPWNPNYADGK